MARKIKRPSLFERHRWQPFNAEKLLFKLFPHILLESLSRYFRIEVEGLENIPRQGPAIIAPNHSGYLGFDALILAHQIENLRKRKPHILTHYLWFMSDLTRKAAGKFGLVEASRSNGLKVLQKKQLLIVFPEAEYGNFKPSTQAYQLQEFRLGFVRMALECQCPVVPTLIIGAEETHLNLSQLKLPEFLRNQLLPVPLNFFPFPARWKIKFLPPIRWPLKPEVATQNETVAELAEDFRDLMQRELSHMIASRPSVYL